MNIHYCMGFLKDVSIGHEKHHCCCGSEKLMDSCCEDVHVSLNIDDDQVPTSHNIFPLISEDLIAAIYFEFNDIGSNSDQIRWITSGNDPPPKKSISRIFIKSLILYA